VNYQVHQNDNDRGNYWGLQNDYENIIIEINSRGNVKTMKAILLGIIAVAS
jgi:hypothetical protein